MNCIAIPQFQRCYDIKKKTKWVSFFIPWSKWTFQLRLQTTGLSQNSHKHCLNAYLPPPPHTTRQQYSPHVLHQNSHEQSVHVGGLNGCTRARYSFPKNKFWRGGLSRLNTSHPLNIDQQLVVWSSWWKLWLGWKKPHLSLWQQSCGLMVGSSHDQWLQWHHHKIVQ